MSSSALDQILVTGSGYTREVRLLSPEKRDPVHLCLILDAEFYLDRIGAEAKISSLLARDSFPPTVFAFVSHIDNAHRHRDYACDSRYSAFLANEVVDEVANRFPSLAGNRHSVCGLSLSGLAAACLVLHYPRRFAGAACQSGSFWWNGEWLTENFPELSGKRFYLSVGNGETQAGISHQPSGMRQEVSQLDACRRFAEKAAQMSHRVRFEVFEGGHEMEPWGEELPEALEWLITEICDLS